MKKFGGSLSVNVVEIKKKFPVVDVQNLTVVRGKYKAVESVSFKVFPGSNTAIIGANGAGKSTLIQAILGLIPYESGDIEILGKQIKDLGKYWHQVGYIPQKLIFDRSFPLTVAELVGLGLPQSSFMKSREKVISVEKALLKVKLQNHRKQRIGSLSGGELKRVLLAYCLVQPRQLLILDEVMAGIDATGEAEFSELLTNLQTENGFSILQVSHDLDMVSRYCDQVICINRRILCHGKPSVTLNENNLSEIYGEGFTRYFHHH
ncbi:metal ABC transporter ATP-binding protein [Hydrocoleum sp. CS-953]|uniref:metal ABC transporter ATP-binding protein n=1 Tax=Hydrocoleum sp. CS-953 TaxID=1671698 RepID=UPI001FEDFBE9|nr:metal ABC transporter ATP-binding protein [Hydrocoleum sp. CS-953]